MKKLNYEDCWKIVNAIKDNQGTPIDENIKHAITMFMSLGLKTSGSCEGHSDHGLSYPWIDFDAEDLPEEDRISFNQMQLEYVKYMFRAYGLDMIWIEPFGLFGAFRLCGYK